MRNTGTSADTSKRLLTTRFCLSVSLSLCLSASLPLCLSASLPLCLSSGDICKQPLFAAEVEEAGESDEDGRNDADGNQ